jgi:hypothetical protein
MQTNFKLIENTEVKIVFLFVMFVTVIKSKY